LRQMVALCAVIVVFIMVGLFLIQPGNGNGEMTAAADRFAGALAQNDLMAAQALASGSALHNIKANGQAGSFASDTKVSVLDVSGSGKWAAVDIVAESPKDVNWYRLYLVNRGKGPRVYRVEPSVPVLPERSKQSDVPLNVLEQTFKGYLESLIQKDWEKASEYLAGPVLKAHETSREYLSGGRFISGEVKDLKAEPLWGSERMAAVVFNYEIENREISVLTTFYQVEQGWWRIVNVSQL